MNAGPGMTPPYTWSTASSDTTVVWLPEKNAAAYTVLPSAEAASARGVSAKRVIFVRRLPPRRAGVVRVEHPDVRATAGRVVQVGIVRRVLAAVGGRDERAALARAREDDVARLVADEQRVDARAGCRGSSTWTMLTESDRWLTTHTSPFDRTATASGSRPVTTEPIDWRWWPSIRNTSRRLSGVFAA